jgi:uncharacterized protein
VHGAKTPLIWVLEGSKAGDNAQLRELAARLPGRIEFKRLGYNEFHRRRNYLLGASLVSVENGKESLVPPWPDLVIGIGRRSVPVARWIRRQSGGRARLVQMGRPRARLGIFDLVITTPQYGLPLAPNVVVLRLPLVPRIELPERELDFWRGEFADLPRPIIAVFIGGPASPFGMDQSVLSELFNGVEALKRSLSGSVIAVGSPRTPQDAFIDRTEAPGAHCRYFPWARDRRNPYHALLEIADRFVVTSDSVSMLAEALRTGKPVDVFRLPITKKKRRRLRKVWPFSLLVRWGLLSPKRDVAAFVSQLLADRHIAVLGGEDIVRVPIPPREDHVFRRIQALLAKL